MSYKYIVNHIPKTANGVKNPKRPAHHINWWEYITIHTTGNPNSSALAERRWLTNINNKSVVAYHFVVDEFNLIECIPPWENAWHCGDGANGTGNRKSIGLEICEYGNLTKSVNNAVHFVANLIVDKVNRTGLDIRVRDVVVQHNRWNGSNCPRLLRVGGKWERFLVDVETMVKDMLVKKVEKVEEKKSEITQIDHELTSAINYLKRYHEPTEYRELVFRLKQIIENSYEKNDLSREQLRQIFRR